MKVSQLLASNLWLKILNLLLNKYLINITFKVIEHMKLLKHKLIHHLVIMINSNIFSGLSSI